ncbi:hypothetical protein BSL78_28202 [Apostichopus japonicus]|uniref:tRNA wybutosine-synthesizing protein 4 n=1 Tax=Stichopus japonicus TaxID=307972 RepID=A0A2G8JGU5_STIJA|nr:hypothetical protein BSL78_28202 [Apostichopus japonicus]
MMAKNWHEAGKIVECFKDVDADTFVNEIYPMRIPAVLKGVDIGSCTQKWTTDYLCRNGSSQSVKVHVSTERNMDFVQKNYSYRTLPFDELIKRCAESSHEEYFFDENEKYYLRALGADNRKDVANIEKEFPELSKDVRIPPFFDKDQFFSSVLRVGSPDLQLWTHYDIMDNILMQIKGTKRVVLFSPQDAGNIYLKGDKSMVLDIENPDFNQFPLLASACPYHCILHPGDCLFIPAMWFHNVVAHDFSISVNVFWKHLSSDLYDPKDPYGNKDPIPAGQALQGLRRALKLLDKLPDEYKDFYGRRMVLEIEQKTYYQGNG